MLQTKEQFRVEFKISYRCIQFFKWCLRSLHILESSGMGQYLAETIRLHS